MTIWSRVRSWLRAMLRRSRMESEMDTELRFHIEAFAEDLVRSGVPQEEALRRARIEFGGIERAKEECRDARGVNFIESLLQDLRYAVRILRKSPYGALSYLVTLRRTEFGIRVALGALPGSILSLVMKDVAAVLVGGLAAGALVSLLTVRFLQKMLFGLTAHDPITMVAAIGLLSAVALLAGYLPARRAMRVDPMAALRYE